jgi:rod shape-determining protein MreD
MKLLVMAILIIINVFLSGSVFTQIYLFGAAPDILICFAASIICIEKRVNGIIFAMIGGFVLDIIFANVLGFYTLQYFIGSVAMYYVASRSYTDSIFVTGIIAAIGVVAKEIVACTIVFFMDQSFSFVFVLLRYILPVALTSGLLALLTELFMKWIYSFKFMTRRATTEFLDNL